MAPDDDNYRICRTAFHSEAESEAGSNGPGETTILKCLNICYKSSVLRSSKMFGFDFHISIRPDDFIR